MFLHNLIRKDRWPLYAAAIVLMISVVMLMDHLLKATGGQLSLPNDDSYLQLSTAKSLAFRHLWGVGRHNFVAASPSLLYPLALAACFFLFGAHLMVVPILNTIIGVALLAQVQKWLAKKGIVAVNQLFILLAVVILSPLPAMVVYGVESPLLLFMAFLFASRLIDQWRLAEFSRSTLLYGALMVACRYDGALVIAGICLLLIWRRRWLAAFELALWCLLPALVFGFISVFKGGFFLPNMFILRQVSLPIGYDWLVGGGIAIIFPLVRHFSEMHQTKPGIVAGTAVVGMVILLFANNLYAVRGLADNSIDGFKMKDPIVRFVHRYYYRYGITSDDIGMISFLTDGRYVDLSGLANTKITRGRTEYHISPGLIGRVSEEQGSRIAIISNHYDKGLPDKWIKMATWELPGNVSWTFYAIDTLAATYLKKNLDDYKALLPKDINAQYYYLPHSRRKSINEIFPIGVQILPTGS